MQSVRLRRVLRSAACGRKPRRILSLARVTLSPDACRRLGVDESPTIEVRITGGQNRVFSEYGGRLHYEGGTITVQSRRFMAMNRQIIEEAKRAFKKCTGADLLGEGRRR